MFFDKSLARRTFGLVLSLLLGTAVANASSGLENSALEMNLFSLSLGGGYGLSAGLQGLIDIKTELQFGLTPRIRIGAGVGYIGKSGNSGLDQNTLRRSGPFPDQGAGDGQDIRLIPLSLNVYYFLPLGPRWSVSAGGGGSYYLADLRGLSTKNHQGLFGGQGGLGVEYHIARGVSLVAEGNYRLVDVRGLSRLRLNDTPPGEPLADFSGLLRGAPPHSGINLHGFSLRLGIKINL